MHLFRLAAYLSGKYTTFIIIILNKSRSGIVTIDEKKS